MNAAEKVKLLISRYEQLRREGTPVDLADLCQSEPGLLAEARKHLDATKDTPEVPSTDGNATLPSAWGEPARKGRHEDKGRHEESTCPAWPAISGFRVLDELGHGGMGVVYKAQQEQPRRTVALKMIRSGTRAMSSDLARFEVEANAVARLQHPHIVQIHSVGSHDGLPYFCLEFLEGGTLAGRIKGQPLSPIDAASIAEKLARAMHAAHQAGIIHRDLKPANVLLAANSEPKISDFGLARQGETSDLTMSGVPMGTPSYMAPEQAEGRTREIGPATDVYGLGAILYEMLTGKPPFRGNGPQDTLKLVLEKEPTPPAQLNPRVPRDLETICLKCLQKQHSARYPSAEALADDLRRFQEGLPIQARPVGRMERTWRWCQRHPARAGLLTAMALLMLVGSAALIQYLRQRANENANRQLLAEELNETEACLRGGERDRAGQCLAKARARLDPASPAGLRQHVEKLEAWLSFADEAEKVRDGFLVFQPQMAKSPEDNARLHGSHRLMDVGWLGEVPCGNKYLEAFNRVGLKIDEQEAEQIASAILECPVRDKAAEALHHWFGNDRTRREKLFAILERVGPHHDWLSGLRRCMWEEKGELGQLDPATMSPHMLRCTLLTLQNPVETVRLGKRLGGALPVGEKMRVMELFVLRAREALPDDFYFNLTAAGACLTAQPPRYEEALGFARAAQALKPSNPAASYLLGYLQLVHRNDARGALSYFKKTLQEEPTHLGAFTAMAHAYERLGDRAQALHALDEALAHHPGSALIHSHRATLLRSTDFKAAKADALQAVALDPNDAMAHNNLAMLLEQEGDLKGAVGRLQKAIDCGPVAVAYYNLGSILRKQKDLEGAILAYNRAVDLNPAYALAFNNLGSCLAEKKDFAGALKAYEKATEVDPTFATAFSNLGYLLTEMDELDAAIRACQKSIALDPMNFGGHVNLGAAYKKKSEWDLALKAYRAAAKVDPASHIPYEAMGDVFLEKKDRVAGIPAWIEARKRNPGNEANHIMLASAYLENKQLEPALEALSQGAKIAPTSVAIHNLRGVTLMDHGRNAQAAEAYRESLKLLPGAKELQIGFAVSAIRHAEEMQKQEKMREAILIYQDALMTLPDNEILTFNLALCLNKWGKVEEALQYYRKTVAINPRHGNAWTLIGSVNMRMKKFDDAVTAFVEAEKIHEIDPKQYFNPADLKRARKYANWEAQLRQWLAGELKLMDPIEAARLALFSIDEKEYHAAGVRLLRLAFAGSPDLEGSTLFRSQAAFSAILASAHLSKDVNLPNEKEAATLRIDAFRWLLADLIQHLKMGQVSAMEKRKSLQALQDWQTNASLAPVRELTALGRLDAQERLLWFQFWMAVETRVQEWKSELK